MSEEQRPSIPVPFSYGGGVASFYLGRRDGSSRHVSLNAVVERSFPPFTYPYCRLPRQLTVEPPTEVFTVETHDGRCVMALVRTK